MAQASQIRVGLIGHGLAGAFIHAPLIEATPQLRITAIATSRAETLALRAGAPRAVADAIEVCTADDVDLVVVASPNLTHAPLAAAALQAGKHVVVDKPFTLSVEDADRLIGLAKAKGRVLSVFLNRRWDGDFTAVRESLASGELGRISLFESRWDRFRPNAAPGWRNQPGAGAGVLWDLGPHLLDQALQLFGEPDSWTADLATQRAGAEADDYFEITLRYGPMRCVLSASSLLPAARPRFALHGDRASLLTYGVDSIEAALRRGESPGEQGFRARLPPTPAVRVEGDGARTERMLPAGDWTRFYIDIARAIIDGRAPAVDAADARAGIAILATAHQSLNAG